jgi:hypothetical protein
MYDEASIRQGPAQIGVLQKSLDLSAEAGLLKWGTACRHRIALLNGIKKPERYK